jgi:hypothetical protein
LAAAMPHSFKKTSTIQITFPLQDAVSRKREMLYLMTLSIAVFYGVNGMGIKHPSRKSML